MKQVNMRIALMLGLAGVSALSRPEEVARNKLIASNLGVEVYTKEERLCACSVYTPKQGNKELKRRQKQQERKALADSKVPRVPAPEKEEDGSQPTDIRAEGESLGSESKDT